MAHLNFLLFLPYVVASKQKPKMKALTLSKIDDESSKTVAAFFLTYYESPYSNFKA